MRSTALGTAGLLFLVLAAAGAAQTAAGQAGPDLDRKVRSFQEAHAGEWQDMNVSEADGRILYDLIVHNKYTRALEISRPRRGACRLQGQARRVRTRQQ